MSWSRLPTAAVVGCGDVSLVHREALQAMEQRDQVRLVAVCDPDPGRLHEAEERQGVAAFADHRVMLESVRPDVVHVCTPHDQHVPAVLSCIDAGVHVLVEKPLAHDSRQAQLIVDAAAARPAVKVGVCLQNRYNRAVRAAKALLESGELGEVVGVSASVVWHRTPAYYRSSPWRGQKSRSGGGVLMNQAIHTVDLLQWLMGDVVQAAGRTSRDSFGADDFGIDVEDTAHLVLDHASGSRSVLFATLSGAMDFPVTMEIVTASGAVLLLRHDLTVTRADGSVETVREREAASVGRSYWGVSHALLIEDFYARVHDEEPFWIGPEQAMAAQLVIAAAMGR